MASTICSPVASNGLLSLSSFPLPNAKAHVPVSSVSFNHRLKPIFDFIYLKVKPPRLGISQKLKTPSQHLFRVSTVYCLVEDEAGIFPESRGPLISSDSSRDAVIDIKLPRRSLLVKFTCNACGARSEKFVNRLAYERGTVFVQCSGCFRHHKLVDNLGLVVEYNFLEETNGDPDVNQL